MSISQIDKKDVESAEEGAKQRSHLLKVHFHDDGDDDEYADDEDDEEEDNGDAEDD